MKMGRIKKKILSLLKSARSFKVIIRTGVGHADARSLCFFKKKYNFFINKICHYTVFYADIFKIFCEKQEFPKPNTSIWRVKNCGKTGTSQSGETKSSAIM